VNSENTIGSINNLHSVDLHKSRHTWIWWTPQLKE